MKGSKDKQISALITLSETHLFKHLYYMLFSNNKYLLWNTLFKQQIYENNNFKANLKNIDQLFFPKK